MSTAKYVITFWIFAKCSLNTRHKFILIAPVIQIFKTILWQVSIVGLAYEYKYQGSESLLRKVQPHCRLPRPIQRRFGRLFPYYIRYSLTLSWFLWICMSHISIIVKNDLTYYRSIRWHTRIIDINPMVSVGRSWRPLPIIAF